MPLAVRSVCSPTCKARAFGSGPFATASRTSRRARTSSSRPIRSSGRRSVRRRPMPSSHGEVGVGDEILADDGMVRLQVVGCERRRDPLPHRPGRTDRGSQRAQPAGRRHLCTGAHAEGHRRSSVRARHRGRSGGVVVRSPCVGRRTRAGRHGQRGQAGAGARQAGEARGGRGVGRRPRRLRRADGRSRGSRCRAPTRAGAARPEAGRAGRPRAGEAGHRGHADARVHDHRVGGRREPRSPMWQMRSSTGPTR